MEYICEQCGKAFVDKASVRRRFCSRACACANPAHRARPKKERAEKVCRGCGVTFRQEGYLRRGPYCSQKCAAKIAIKAAYSDAKSNNKRDLTKWVNLVCPTCGGAFQRAQSQIRKHCSRRCSDTDPDVKLSRVMGRRQSGSYDAKASYSRSKRGERRGTYFRSRMEANCAAYLDFLGVEWQYEKKTFWFPKGSICLSYLPDFYLPKEKRYIEVKGFMDARSKEKLRLMALHHPDIVLSVIGRTEYEEIATQAHLITGWEYG